MATRTVRVPKTPQSSFDKNRRPSKLLLDQIKHLEWAVLPASQRKPRQLAKYQQVRTEAQAAERIAQLTDMLLKAKEEGQIQPFEPGVQPKVVLPPLPKAGARKRRARSKRR
jgi:hypothetical protein